MAMVSGYRSQLYAARLAGWSAITFQAMTCGGRPATEWLWFKFPPPVACMTTATSARGFVNAKASSAKAAMDRAAATPDRHARSN